MRSRSTIQCVCQDPSHPLDGGGYLGGMETQGCPPNQGSGQANLEDVCKESSLRVVLGRGYNTKVYVGNWVVNVNSIEKVTEFSGAESRGKTRLSGSPKTAYSENLIPPAPMWIGGRYQIIYQLGKAALDVSKCIEDRPS